jgi:prepilin-type processing-associated H-X9-DG protein
MRDNQHQTDKRQALTVLELLVTIAIIGVLVGLLLPALMAARESARRMQCTSNLHELGIAVQQYHDMAHKLPSAWTVASDVTSGYGWALDLLPYVEEADLQKRVARKAPITAAANDLVRNTDLPIMRCPSDIAEPTFELFPEISHHASARSSATAEGAPDTPATDALVSLPAANYVGVYGTLEADETFPAPKGDGPIISDRKVRLEDLSRGQSHTLIIGERTTAMVPSTWLGIDFHGEDAACRIVGSAMTSPNCEPCDECEFASRHSGGANFVWADGHVSLIADDIESYEYQRLAKRQDN